MISECLDVIALFREFAQIVLSGGQSIKKAEDILGASRNLPNSNLAILVGGEDFVSGGD